MSHLIFTKPTRITASGQIHIAPNFLMDMLIGTDGVNNPTVAAYNEADSSKTASARIFPSQTYDAIALGLNGIVLQFARYLDTGLYVEVSNLGSGEIIIGSRLASDVSMVAFR